MAVHAPDDFIAPAHTNATRPLAGRMLVMVCRDFTMKPFGEKSLAGAVNADCK